MSVAQQHKKTKKTFWTIFVFYGLIAFEFFYMASPFALYFYSAYRPGLNSLAQVSGIAWLTGFFLPHIVVETSCTLVNLHNIIGVFLTGAGLVLFCIGAVQVYYYRLTKKGIVTKGLYTYIRHPQYTALILCSFGLLLLWPRYLVLFLFITLLFAYYFLARSEERECLEKYGQSYSNYQNGTYMFLPFRMPFKLNRRFFPSSKIGRILSNLAIYIFTVLLSLSFARIVHSLSLESLYIFHTKDAIYLSINDMEKEKISTIVRTALANAEVQKRLTQAKDRGTIKFLNYLLPADWYISEIPMQMTEIHQEHYLRLGGEEHQLYKIIFTQAVINENQRVTSQNFLRDVLRTNPVMEVWIDIQTNRIIGIKEPPISSPYENILMPVY